MADLGLLNRVGLDMATREMFPVCSQLLVTEGAGSITFSGPTGRCERPIGPNHHRLMEQAAMADRLSNTEIEWRPIPDFPGYEISEFGVVRRTLLGPRTYPGKIRRTKKHHCGYRRVALTRNGANVSREVYRLVALAFIGPCPFPGAEVAHNDGSKTNDHWTNLRWATRQENNDDRVIHGTNSNGSKNGTAKLKEEQILEMRALRAAGATLAEIGLRFGVAFQTVSKIVRNERWRHI